MHQQHPLSAWLEMLRTGSNEKTFLQLARAPKFWVENHSQLPPLEQAGQALTPPTPYSTFLLGTEIGIDVTGKEELKTSAVVAMLATAKDNGLLLELTVTLKNSLPAYLGAFSTKSFTPAACKLSELQFQTTHVFDAGPEFWILAKRLFICFMGLLASENVSISSPPTKFARKREFERISAGKRVENYHIHHLRIDRKRSKNKGTGEGKARRGHWRCAHLRHYTAGVGHIKTTKTIAIAPMFVGDAADTLHKDYIV